MGFFGWLTGTDKYGAAQNALIAKYTFSQLTEHDKDYVRAVAHGILEAGGHSPDMIDEKIAKMREAERYCLYSMAMAAGGIKPALKGVLYNDQWYHIPNPFAALINAEKQIKIAQYEIKNKYNIYIDLADNNKGAANDNLGQKQRASKDYKEKTSPIFNAKFVLIPAGTFMMGSPEYETGREDDEALHQVTISGPFYLQTTPVTQGQWKKVMGSNPSFFQGDDDCPAENVSWNDAQEFISKLNFQTGKNYRLPTEAEWEYAARSGGKKEKWAGTNDKNELGDYAWYDDNSGSKTHPVGQKKPNGLGLYDMAGNVWEWCSDWYGEKYYGASTRDNPRGPGSGEDRVLRGGSYFNDALYARAANRFYMSPDIRGSNLGFGFRVAASAR